MNQNMHHNNPHLKPFDAPVTAEEMQRMPGVEDRSKRTRMGKIFHLGRNLHQAVLFADPVHYRDQATGQWQEIDNTLIPRTDAAGHTFLTNRANDELNVEFHDTTDAATVLLQDEQHHLLAWKLADAQEIAPVRVDRPCLEHNDYDLRRDVLAHIEDEVLYAAIFPGVDLRCRIQGLSFKDELVFHAPEAVRPVTFVLAAPGLHPVLRENGDIDWLAADDSVDSVVFTLPKPFLKDQQPEHATGAVAVALEPLEEDLWRLTMTLDEAWLQEAQFPVVLDPAVITRKHATSIEDNFITSKKPSTVQPYAGNGMTVSYNSSNWGTSKAFIKFLGSGLPQIDSSYYVTKAFFSVMTKSKPTTAASVYLKEVLGDWSSQTLTYQNAPALNDMPLDYTYMSATNTWYTYDVSNLVRKWYSGVNYGIALEATTSTYLELYTSDASYKPYVTINYVSLVGLEDYLVYDAIGNPLSDGNWNLTWVDGRRLRSMYKGEAGHPGYDEITFEYNESGLRTKKNRMFYDSATGTVRQQTTEYTLHGKNIVHWSSGTNTMHFFYDAQNKPAVVVHNGKPYGYLYNLQGDVIALIDSSGNRVVEYRYDAWGRILSKTGTMADSLGTINPFRYRGYVYDGETGLYYLRSRYYKPNWARFLNRDKQLALAGCNIVSNVFVYCMNSPTNRVDTDGAKAENLLKPAPVIGGNWTTDELYSAYEKFVMKYHEVSKGKWWNVPHLERTNDCFGITNVEYSISTRHVSSARQIISDIVSHVGNLATLIGEGGGAYTISAAAAYMGCFIDLGVLSQAADFVSQACDAFGKVDDLYAIRDLGHDHEVHTLRIQRDAIKKTVHVFSFEVWSIGTCPTEMQYITLYGWQTN